MARLLRMPEVDDDRTDAMLTDWLVSEEGAFAGAQSIARVETESSVVSVEVSEPGVLLKVLVAPGDRVVPGRPLAVLTAVDEVVDDIDALMTRLGVAVSPSAGAEPVARHTTWAPPDRADVPAAAREVPAEVSAEVPAEVPTEVPAEVSAGVATTVQARFRSRVRAEPLLAVVGQVPAVSTFALVVKAAVTAMRRAGAMPWSGGSTGVRVERWDGSQTVESVVHVAGLMTATALADVLERAGSTPVDDPAQESVLIVDLASYGVQEASRDAAPDRPVVLAVGAVTEEAVVVDGGLTTGRVVVISLTCDESRVDPGAAARWLAELGALLENPLLFLT